MNTLPITQLPHQAKLPSMERPAGEAPANVMSLAANVATLVGMTLIAPAALGTGLGLLTPVISLAAQALFLQEDLAAGGDQLATKIANMSVAAAIIQAVAIYTFVMMSTLGFFTGVAVTAALAGATYFAAGHEDGENAGPVMAFLNAQLALVLPRPGQQPA